MPVTEIYILVPHLLRCVLWFATREIIPNTIPTYPLRGDLGNIGRVTLKGLTQLSIRFELR